MSSKKQSASIVGVGATACAVCCAGPSLAVLAAIGLGAAAGFALLGTIAIALGGAAVTFVLWRRRRRSEDCVVADEAQPVRVELSDIRARS